MTTSRFGLLLFKFLLLSSLLLSAACVRPNSNRTSVLSQITVGERMLHYGDYDKAYTLLDKVAQNNPRSTVAALGLADAYFREKALLKAVQYYRKAEDLGARTDGRLGLARVELARNNPERAKAFLIQVLARERGNLDALNALGVAHDLEGQHAKAQQYYRSVLAQAPSNTPALNNYALSLTLSGKGQEAYPFIAELSRSNQHDVVVRQNLALVQHLAGYSQTAMRTALLDLSQDEAQSNFAQLSSLGTRR